MGSQRLGTKSQKREKGTYTDSIVGMLQRHCCVLIVDNCDDPVKQYIGIAV